MGWKWYFTSVIFLPQRIPVSSWEKHQTNLNSETICKILEQQNLNLKFIGNKENLRHCGSAEEPKEVWEDWNVTWHVDGTLEQKQTWGKTYGNLNEAWILVNNNVSILASPLIKWQLIVMGRCQPQERLRMLNRTLFYLHNLLGSF